MNSKQKLSLGFLILGVIFSSFIRIRFNISNGFEFHNFWITPLPSIIQIAAIKSNDLTLTTTFVGYIFLGISGLIMLKDFKVSNHKGGNLSIFLCLIVIAFTFECFAIIQDYFSNFSGIHLRAGIVLFLLGISIFYKNYKTVNF